jgi:ribonucleoside-diphosphate reductase beta chain
MKKALGIFNKDNTAWQAGEYPLFLGEAPALYDSVNVSHPKLFQLYKKQKATDWSEDEISLEQSRIDMLTCPPETRDIMVKNLALQWEFDSVASRAIAPLFAPFITNSEFWASILKNTEIEVTHALTYSEIVRQCILDPQEIFKEVLTNKSILGRMEPVADALNRLQVANAKYTLGMISKDEAYSAVMFGLVALYCLERLQFVASFAATFAVVEQGFFQGIGKLVQKIMQDERFIHAEVDKYALETELATDRGFKWMEDNHPKVAYLVDSVVEAEYDWGAYLFSEGRKVVGLNEQLMKDWVNYNSQEVYETLKLQPKTHMRKSPLKFMENWLDLNKNQNAQQEADSANYSLNIIIDDVGDEILDFA